MVRDRQHFILGAELQAAGRTRLHAGRLQPLGDAVDAEASTPQDTAVTIDVTGNDVDPDGEIILRKLENHVRAKREIDRVRAERGLDQYL